MSDKNKKVYTSGSWDMFHVGHLNILEKSKKVGDYLVVGVSNDELIKEYKGIAPVIPFADRFRIIESLACVDLVVEQHILTEITQLQELEIDVVTIGDDWIGKHLDGLEWMKNQDGKEVLYMEYTPSVSSTGIKQKIINSTYEIITAQFQREIKAMEEWKRKQ